MDSISIWLKESSPGIWQLLGGGQYPQNHTLWGVVAVVNIEVLGWKCPWKERS